MGQMCDNIGDVHRQTDNFEAWLALYLTTLMCKESGSQGDLRFAMSSSFRLFSTRGIDVRIHVTFPLILVWAAIQFGILNDGGLIGALFGVIVISLLFAIVTLHELGHSLAALRFGVPVEQIVLLPIGGVAQLKSFPEKPAQELVIAVAGPAVNFGLALIMGLMIILLDIQVGNFASILNGLDRITFTDVFTYVFIYNLFLGVFNLLPAFPMDGGRVLRALLATRLEYTRATTIAVTVGQGMAWLLGLYGFLGGGFFTILIALFIYMGAGQEKTAVQGRFVLRGLVVAQAFSQAVQSLRPESTLQDAVNLTLSGFQASFPVCEGERLVGLLTYPMLVQALSRHGPGTLVEQIMVRDVPVVSPRDELLSAQRRLSESQLEAVPVIDGDRFLGLITNRDINEVFRFVSVDPDLLPRAAAS
jgi:Zn-dependent protease/CBS domain-containing protein